MGTFNQEAIIISGSRTGMGTALPQAELHISGANNDSLFRIQSPASASIIFVTGSGLVGIGTLTPTQKLSVDNGNVGFTSGFGISWDSDTEWIKRAAASDQLQFATQNTVRLNIGSTQGQLVAIGLGTTAASAQFQVRGGGATSGTTAMRIEDSGGNARLTILDDGTSAFNTSHLYVSSSGRIGIGTATPTMGVLDINGITRIRSSNQLYFGGTTANDWQGAISGQASGLLVNVNLLTINNSGYASPATQSFLINTSQNVAIGPHSPTARLHISGANNQSLLQVSSPSATNALFVSGSGNVGIGTATPTSRLQVSLPSNTSNQSIFRSDAGDNLLAINTFPTTNRMQLLLGDYNGTATPNLAAISDGDTGIQWAGSNIIRFVNGGSENVTINASGNVGIGTTSPTERLHVAGNLLVTGRLTAQEFHTSLVSASIIYQSGSTQFGNSSDDTHQFTGSLRVSGSITGSLFGTASWAQNALTSSFITPTGTNAFVQSGNSFGATALLGTNDTQDLQFETSGSVRMTISSSGNIGIGTTSPSARLEVSGSDVIINTVNIGLGGGNISTNTRVGLYALRCNTTGAYNTAVGRSALYANTTGGSNTALGFYALRNNTTGGSNTAVGLSALLCNTTGTNNTAVGLSALRCNTTGGSNTALGVSALRCNTTGNSNTAVGYYSLRNNTTGTNNTAVGRNALYANTTGTNNTAVGLYALRNNTTGTNNTAVGRNALYANTTGNNNTAIGRDALCCNTTGINNTAVGFYSLRNNTSGRYNTAVGLSALRCNTTGNSNTAVGRSALYANTTGVYNTAVGRNALQCNTTGCNNTAVGLSALRCNTTGNSNTAVGFYSLRNNTSGTNNTAVGRNALYANTTGGSNTAIGRDALCCNTTGGSNTAVGFYALRCNTTGGSNTAVGLNALYANTTGTNNTAVGLSALQCNTTGTNNTAVGLSALRCNTTGAYNTAVGRNALRNNSGSNNISIGNNAGCCITSGASNVVLGSATAAGFETQNCNIFISDGAGNIRIFATGSNGNVGIGTTNPSANLDVNGNSIYLNPAQLLIVTSGSVDREGSFIASSTGRTLQFGIFDNSQVPVGIDMFETNNAFTSTYINFRVNNSNLVRMTGSNVGIGTNLPSANLHISGASADSLLQVSSPSASSALFVSGSGNVGIGTSTPAGLIDIFQGGNSRILVTTDTGRVGIQQSSPAEQIHITSDPVNGKYLRIDAAQISNSPREVVDSPATAILGYDAADSTKYLSEPRRWMEIKLDGNTVLIPCYQPDV
jgi:hypothetical protein